jgi:hypothetical protein
MRVIRKILNNKKDSIGNYYIEVGKSETLPHTLILILKSMKGKAYNRR